MPKPGDRPDSLSHLGRSG